MKSASIACKLKPVTRSGWANTGLQGLPLVALEHGVVAASRTGKAWGSCWEEVTVAVEVQGQEPEGGYEAY